MIKFRQAHKPSPFSVSPSRNEKPVNSFIYSKGPSPLVRKGIKSDGHIGNLFEEAENEALEK